jgi:hypothetical protein
MRTKSILMLSVAASASVLGIFVACSSPELNTSSYACNAAADCLSGFVCAPNQAGKKVCQDAKLVALDAGTGDGANDAACAPNPMSAAEFLNRCDRGQCQLFDNARINGLPADGKLPELPPPVDAGVTDGGGTTDASGADAGPTYPACSSLPNVVHLSGANAFKRVIAQLATSLAKQSPATTVVFSQGGACQGVELLFEPGRTVGFYKITTASYWDPALGEQFCQVDDSTQVAAIGISGLFPSTCNAGYVGTPELGDFLGPVQTTAFVVPYASSERSISAEAAYYLYGLGSTAVTPWTNRNLIFTREKAATVEQVIAKSLGVPPERIIGTVAGSTDKMIKAVVTASDPNGGIGMLDSSFAENATYKTQLRMLAYRAFGQSCALFPNSTERSTDKKNVRLGAYPLWSPIHFIARVNTQTGEAVNPTVGKVLAYLTGRIQVPNFDFLNATIVESFIPQCAMQVTRSSDLGAQTVFHPKASCSCRFDEVTSGSAGGDCATCVSDTACPAAKPHCNFGYCEAN